MIKRLFQFFGIFLVLILAAIIIIPFVVDVDRYRPEIVKIVNEKINGQFKMGKLGLSLWGQIKVEIAGIELEDVKQKQILAVKDTYLHVPFRSLLDGTPNIMLVMNEPFISIKKDQKGKLNLLGLIKSQKPDMDSEKGQPSTGSSDQSADSKKVSLPLIVTQARFGMDFNRGKISYEDLQSGIKNQFDDFNLLVRDLSLDRPLEVEAWSNLSTVLKLKNSPSLKLNGPFKMSTTIRPVLKDFQFQGASGDLSISLKDLEISLPGLFQKQKGVIADFEGQFQLDLDRFSIQKSLMRFNDLHLKIQTTLSGWSENQSQLEFKADSNPIELSQWTEILPLLKSYQPKGSVEFKISATGPMADPKYDVRVQARRVGAQLPGLALSPEFKLDAQIIPDQIPYAHLEMTAPGTEVKTSLKLVSFTAPKIGMNIRSSRLDLDRLLGLEVKTSEAKAPSVAGAPSSKGSKTKSTKNPSSEDFDQKLDPLRKNPMLRGVDLKADVDLRQVKAMDSVIPKLQTTITFKDLVATMTPLTFEIWKGVLSIGGKADLKPQKPTYSFSSKVDHLDLRDAVRSQYAPFKNTVLGILTLHSQGSGASFNPSEVKKNLRLKGKMKVDQAIFTTIDVGKMASEAINQAVERVASKIPKLKGKKVKALPKKETRYEYLTSNFSLSGGVFQAPDFYGRAENNRAVDLQGTTQVNIITYDLDARWKVIDRFNVTHAADLSVEHQGVRVDHVLAEGNPPVVSFPVTVGCNLLSPCYSYTEVPEHLTNIALRNFGNAAKAKLKGEAQKKVEQAKKKLEEEAKKALGDKAKPQLDKLLKKFKF